MLTRLILTSLFDSVRFSCCLKESLSLNKPGLSRLLLSCRSIRSQSGLIFLETPHFSRDLTSFSLYFGFIMPQLYIQVLHFGLRKLANSTAWKNLKQYGTSLISGLFLKYPPKKKRKKKRLVCLYFTVVYMNSIIGVVSH